MSDSLRVNLYLSSSRERELFQHIQGVSPEERASTFKYLAFLGLMVSKNPAGLQKVPLTKNTRNESRREKPLAEPSITDNKAEKREILECGSAFLWGDSLYVLKKFSLPRRREVEIHSQGIAHDYSPAFFQTLLARPSPIN